MTHREALEHIATCEDWPFFSIAQLAHTVAGVARVALSDQQIRTEALSTALDAIDGVLAIRELTDEQVTLFGTARNELEAMIERAAEATA
jgi:hypothetical protein